MKNKNISDKENDYSLTNINNYYKNFNYDISEILNKYIYLINEFLKIILEKTKIKNNYYVKFIIIRGYETLTNVFNIILYYTKNIDLTFYHCQKSYYYYIEFIEQISYEQHVFLELNSRDATTYVYKKTILELNQDFKTNIEPCSDEIKKIMQTIDEQLKILKIMFEFILNKLSLDKSLEKNIEIIYKYQDICKKISISNIETENIKIFYKIIEIINNNFENNFENNFQNEYVDLEKYFELITNILKKCKEKNNNAFWKQLQNNAYKGEL
jgi:hypothetical protein